mgnify:CR=1 FL=1
MKKEAVKINNEQEWDYVSMKLYNLVKPVDFKRYGTTKDICINIHNGNYDYVDYYIRNDYNIISFEEFKSRYEPQLKIGDTFEKDGFVCRVESEVEKWYLLNNECICSYKKLDTKSYLRYKEYNFKITEITNKEFIAQLEKYSQ